VRSSLPCINIGVRIELAKKYWNYPCDLGWLTVKEADYNQNAVITRNKQILNKAAQFCVCISALSPPNSVFFRSFRSAICNPERSHWMGMPRITDLSERENRLWGRERGEIVQTQNKNTKKFLIFRLNFLGFL